MLVATAGHIDHGKTSLIRALTGVETDRLPEERARGISIDLGFAYWQPGDGPTIGFVDVPGHERYVRNMLAGASGVDFALVVVAADDGVMPQTIEHVRILDLLNVARGVVAVTKCDRSSPERIAEVRRQVQSLLASTTLASAAMFEVSATTGAGIAPLAAALRAANLSKQSRSAHDRNFRLAIDRAFSVSGVGTVVTGTVRDGALTVGVPLVLAPSGLETRVRGLQSAGQARAQVQPGERCAINLTDLQVSQVHRGDWLLIPSMYATTTRIEVRLQLLDARALKHNTPVHFHIGTADITARVLLPRQSPVASDANDTAAQIVLPPPASSANAIAGRVLLPQPALSTDDIAVPALLSRPALSADDTAERVLIRRAASSADAIAHIVLDHPTCAVVGDRFILRDHSGRLLLGGGTIVDPLVPTGRRKPSDRAEISAALQKAEPAVTLAALLAIPGHEVDTVAFERRFNLTSATAQALYKQADAVLFETLALPANRIAEITESIVASLKTFHREHPDARGMSQHQIKASLTPSISTSAFLAVQKNLIEKRIIETSGSVLKLPGYSSPFSAADDERWHKVQRLVQNRNALAFSPGEAAADAKISEPVMKAMLYRRRGSGEVWSIDEQRFMLRDQVAALAARAAELAKEVGGRGFTVAQYRDATGIGRNHVIRILEFFDSIGVTRRDGDCRKVRADYHLVVGDAAPYRRN